MYFNKLSPFEDCRSNNLVGPTNAKAIPDASLTGYNMYSSYSAKNARWNGGGWYGMDSTSYLQVDLGLLNKSEEIVAFYVTTTNLKLPL